MSESLIDQLEQGPLHRFADYATLTGIIPGSGANAVLPSRIGGPNRVRCRTRSDARASYLAQAARACRALRERA